MRRLIAAAVLLLGLSVAQAKDIPASPSSYVHNDGVMSAEGARALGAKLAAFEQATGHQFVVAAFQSLDGADLEDYTGQVFKTWKIGDKKRNDGLLLTLFKADRKWRVQTGYGFEGTLTDLQAYKLMSDAAVPLLKKGDVDGGIIAGVDAVIGEIQTASLFGNEKAEPVKIKAKPLVAPNQQVIYPQPLVDPMLMFWLKVVGGFALLIFLIWVTDGDILYLLANFGSSYRSGSGGSSSGSSSSGSSFSGGGGKSGGGGSSGGW